MAIYEHQCQNPNCGHEWEAEYSIKEDPPDICPKCLQKTAKRLISLGGKGVVELTGRDLIDKCKADAKQIQKDASVNENIYSNLIGENNYNNLQTRIDRNKRR